MPKLREKNKYKMNPGDYNVSLVKTKDFKRGRKY